MTRKDFMAYEWLVAMLYVYTTAFVVGLPLVIMTDYNPMAVNIWLQHITPIAMLMVEINVMSKKIKGEAK